MIRVRTVAVLALGAVVSLSSCGGGGGDKAGSDDPGSGTGAEGDVPTVKVISRDNFTFDPSDPTVKAGQVHLVHDNEGDTTHSFVLEGEVRLVDDGDDTIKLDPGEYTFYCDVPGHRAAGMEGVLTVTP
jgi:uncharacterized cupredoxin-like copper-binding protein